MLRAIERTMAPALRRIALTVGRALIELVDDGRGVQQLQLSLLSDELRSLVERIQQYGMTSVPLPGAEAVALAVAGSRDHLVVVAVDDRRYRLRGLAGGEVAIYTCDGDKVVIRRGGTIEVTASTKVQITSPLVTMSGALQVAGSITSGADITAAGEVSDSGGAKTMSGMRAAYDAHDGHGTHGTGATPTPGM